MEDCLFCNMASGRMEVPKLHEDDLVFSIRDIHPQAPVHFMVIPKEHISGVPDIGEQHGPLLARMMRVANEVAEKEGVAKSGYRLAVNRGAGGGEGILPLHQPVPG